MKIWIRSMTAAGMALFATTASVQAQAPGQQPQAPSQPAQAQPGQAPGQTGQGRMVGDGDLPGPIDSLSDVQDTGRMVFAMADINKDGQISQKEAIDAGNLIAGGFFFRADQNGDGVLSQEEAKASRDALFAQQPMLRYVIETSQFQAKQAGNQAAADPAASIGNLLDSNNDKQLQATEVRQAIQTAIQGLYAAADTNRDGQMSPTEINAAIIGAARTAAQAAFQQADGDNNGSLSREEFTKAVTQPTNTVFAILDGDNDGQITQQEAQQAQRYIGSQLRQIMVPEPANSARNLIRSGASPDQVAPVPTRSNPGSAPAARQ